MMLASAAAACGDDPPDVGAAAPQGGPLDIVGGFAGDSVGLDAIGIAGAFTYTPMDRSFVRMQRFYAACTGALISKNVVLTTARCATGLQNAGTSRFRIGPSETDYRQEVSIVSAEALKIAEIEPEPRFGILHLAEYVQSVTPLALAPLADTDVGQTFAAVGYGQGRRDVGVVRLAARRGVFLPLVYPELEAFYRAKTNAAPPPSCEPVPPGWADSCAQRARLRVQYETRTLEARNEVLVGRAADEAHVCANDVGGPLLQQTRDGLTTYGVHSESFGNGPSECELGAVYTAFDRPALEVLRAAAAWNDPCEGVPYEGICESTRVGKRCIANARGQRSVSSFDCGFLGLGCVDPGMDPVYCASTMRGVGTVKIFEVPTPPPLPAN